MSELKDKRIKYTKLLCQLVEWGNNHPNWELAFGRDYDEAHEQFHHMLNSLHYRGLANDLALYISGVYQTKTETYEPLGEYWESLDPECAWGGRFNDGNHFSLIYGGKK
jgi:hypothetical protein